MYSVSPAGCDDVIGLAVDDQQTSEPPAHSGVPSSSGLAGRSPGVLSSQQAAAVIEADQGNLSQHFSGGFYWDGPQRQTQSCVCAYGQREPECVGHCWPGSPCIYYGGECSPPSGSLDIGQDNVQRQTLIMICLPTLRLYTHLILFTQCEILAGGGSNVDLKTQHALHLTCLQPESPAFCVAAVI